MQKWGGLGKRVVGASENRARRGQERVGSRIYKRKAKAEIEKL